MSNDGDSSGKLVGNIRLIDKDSDKCTPQAEIEPPISDYRSDGLTTELLKALVASRSVDRSISRAVSILKESSVKMGSC